MSAGQILKGAGKASMVELISSLGALQGLSIRRFLIYKSGSNKFSITRRQFNLKKPKYNKKENNLDDLTGNSKNKHADTAVYQPPRSLCKICGKACGSNTCSP